VALPLTRKTIELHLGNVYAGRESGSSRRDRSVRRPGWCVVRRAHLRARAALAFTPTATSSPPGAEAGPRFCTESVSDPVKLSIPEDDPIMESRETAHFQGDTG
jgi:hypothetical protein